jgi:hypothetical protein
MSKKGLKMSLKPKTPESSGSKPHKRDQTKNQQTSTAVRPPLPRDGSMDGINSMRGKMPSGYVAVWDFGNGTQTKLSPTSKPGNAGGKDIF